MFFKCWFELSQELPQSRLGCFISDFVHVYFPCYLIITDIHFIYRFTVSSSFFN